MSDEMRFVTGTWLGLSIYIVAAMIGYHFFSSEVALLTVLALMILQNTMATIIVVWSIHHDSIRYGD